MKVSSPFICAGLVASILAMDVPPTYRQLVPDSLNLTQAQDFLDGVAVLAQDYHIFLVAPWTIVIPAENRALQLHGIDRPLVNCVHQYAAGLMLQMGSTQEGRDEYPEARSVLEVEVDDLLATGVQSLNVVDVDLSGVAGFSERSSQRGQYYSTFPSEYPGCEDMNLKRTHYDKCHDSWTPSQSIMAMNSHSQRVLHFTVWPQFNCSSGNPRILAIPTQVIGPCLDDRPIYSHRGYLTDDVMTSDDGKREGNTALTEKQDISKEAARKRLEHKKDKASQLEGRRKAQERSVIAELKANMQRRLHQLSSWQEGGFDCLARNDDEEQDL